MSNSGNLLWARTGRRTREPERGPARLGVLIVALTTTIAEASMARYQYFSASAVPRMPGGFRR